MGGPKIKIFKILKIFYVNFSFLRTNVYRKVIFLFWIVAFEEFYKNSGILFVLKGSDGFCYCDAASFEVMTNSTTVQTERKMHLIERGLESRAH